MDDMGFMGYAIKQSSGHHRVAKYLCPIGKIQVGGYYNSSLFMPFQQYLKK
jgi:hypothetical protein